MKEDKRNHINPLTVHQELNKRITMKSSLKNWII